MSRRTTLLLLLALALLGLVDSLYLTYDHGAFHADPAGYGGGLCGVEGGCVISRTSALSEIPLPGARLALPTSVLALGFYAVFLVLVAVRRRLSPSSPEHKIVARLQLGLSLLAMAFSLLLLVYSLAHASLCKFCVVLYVVNAGLLWVTWKSLGEPFSAFMRATRATVLSRPALMATTVMAVALVGGYLVYRGTVLAARERASERLEAVTIDTTGRPSAGPPDAPVHIIEFADFECPHCRLAFRTLEEVLAERKDLRVSFLHFPLDQACNPLIDRPFHPNACQLAILGECAHAQGRFFEAAGVIFEGAPLTDTIEKLAAKGLDKAALEACMQDRKALARVESDIRAGIGAKIQGTPAVFLNGALIGGAVPKDKLDELIDLAKQAPTLVAPKD